ncbi:MAG: polysaccharide deacetylase family protein [Bacteroidetes bacterium]|nr:polysaccharide deacetylase family protein [Bacteroidota bacterium]
MIRVKLPQTFQPERQYLLEVIFTEFLGIEFVREYTESFDYSILLENGKILIIKDYFFSSLEGVYPSQKNIPEKVEYVTLPFTSEKDLPLLYGNPELIEESDQIICHVDIFASVFFMLTRWEEYVVADRDHFNRFPAEASLAVKNNFLLRPIVNEYIEFLWNLLIHLGINDQRKVSQFRIVPTHDIDIIHYRYSMLRLINDIAKRKNAGIIAKRIKYRITNPFNSFGFIMDLSERNGLTSHFYFMSGGESEYEGFYNVTGKKAGSIFQMIRKRNHTIGFHPSHNTYNQKQLFLKEKNMLQESVNLAITEGRQHNLRFEVPGTWQIWEECSMHTDSSMGYPESDGFRCGTGNVFSVFNYLTRKKLSLKERPLIFMDSTFQLYRKLPITEVKPIADYYKSVCRKYKMPFTLLFHNTSFEDIFWNGSKTIYTNILETEK